MATVRGVYKEVLAAHRQRLTRLADRQGVVQLKRLYDDAVSRQMSKLRGAVRRMGGDTFTVHQQRFVLAQLRQGQAQLAAHMAGELGTLSREAQREAIRGLTSDIARLEGAYRGATVELPLEEAARFAGIMDARKTSLLRAHQASMTRHGSAVVTEVEKQMSVALLTGETPLEAMERIHETIDGEWWQAERIVRTETSWAYNAAHHDAMVEAAEELPDLMMRWNEHCSDDLVPLDDRVAVDSLAMHGQLTAVGGVFTIPETSPVPDGKGETQVPSHLAGLEVEFPPNRPNDRAVLSPWRPGWGIPGWRYVAGRRVPVSG